MLFLSARNELGEHAGRDHLPWAVVVWLSICCVLVFAMVLLGGVTRLTGSGLSIVEWQPLSGIVPPMSHADWLDLFQRYQQFPEFREVNFGMDLAGFKVIFLFEYAHRGLGRLIGLAFALPLAWFWWRGRLPGALKPHLVILFALGALQGVLGWFMVMSGLVDVPRVSPYRLTAHLCLAVAIYGYLLFIVLDLVDVGPAGVMRRVVATPILPAVLVVAVFVMIASGGFVAGTHAGFIYNTFPDMNGEWLPDGLLAMSPWWLNAFENPVAVQFDHRLLGYLLVALAIVNRWHLHRFGPGALVPSANLLVALVCLQAALGVATLVY